MARKTHTRVDLINRRKAGKAINKNTTWAGKSVAQIEQHIDTKVNSMTEVKTLLKGMAAMIINLRDRG